MEYRIWWRLGGLWLGPKQDGFEEEKKPDPADFGSNIIKIVSRQR
jgi:hypothetical protein